ncbi:hypothetical protein IEO21_04728 [Rhodonia placenta]|uniref:Nudix hydrolase domain-containing protein n=1 Tax=Rhodonia placenta TaxID=104341 RepID=A0A8H7P3N5_9APHY|nr:hypothetical protein IEO21_04728 [Postia placenta]
MMERSACTLFGVVTYGVHMSIFEDDEHQRGALDSCRMWVPTRSKSKQTWPGYLDNTVAGGIPCELDVFDSLVQESTEEASLAEEVIREECALGGQSTTQNRTRTGWLQPEIHFVYDLRIPIGAAQEKYKPKPLDGKVDSFELLPLTEVVLRMQRGLFKPGTALVVLDFMIRWGYLKPEDEPGYQEIVTRLHGGFEHDKW